MRKSTLTAAIASLLFVNVAHAQGTYAEVGYMYLDMKAKTPSTSSSASPSGLALVAGSGLNKYLSAELMLAFGLSDDKLGINSASVKLKNIFAVYINGLVPVNRTTHFYGGVGYAKADIKVDKSLFNSLSSGTVSYNDNGVTYKLGLSLGFTKYSSLAFEYMVLPKIDLQSGYNVDTSSINLVYKLAF